MTESDDNPAVGIAAANAAGHRWYAVHCKANQELIARRHLKFQEYEVFLPSIERYRRHARVRRLAQTPLFRGYLFVRLDLSCHRWRSVNSTVGVLRLVMQGERPIAAPLGVIEALRVCCDERGVFCPGDELNVGQSVRIISGPFTDLIGELYQLSDARRVRVLLEIMGGQIPVLVPRESVVPTNSYL